MTDVVSAPAPPGNLLLLLPHRPTPRSSKPSRGSRRRWRRFGIRPHMHRLIADAPFPIAVTENNPVVQIRLPASSGHPANPATFGTGSRRHRDGIRLIHRGPIARRARSTHRHQSPRGGHAVRRTGRLPPGRRVRRRPVPSVWRRCGERPCLHRIGGRAAQVNRLVRARAAAVTATTPA